MVNALCLVVLLSGAAPSPEWSQWRGPNRDATVEPGEAAHPWPAELTRRWRSPVGAGQ
jgi:hypothetical protein